MGQKMGQKMGPFLTPCFVHLQSQNHRLLPRFDDTKMGQKMAKKWPKNGQKMGHFLGPFLAPKNDPKMGHFLDPFLKNSTRQMRAFLDFNDFGSLFAR